MSSASFDAWCAKARSAPIEREIERRGIKLSGNGVERVGPCPKCGGHDRFAINVKKQKWNCRGCGVGGDNIKLVEHLDDTDFITACETLTGEPRPKANGKSHTSTVAEEIPVATFEYHDEAGDVVFATERIEFF